MKEEKICTKCKSLKHNHSFRVIKKSGLLFSWCRDCENLNDKERYKERRTAQLNYKKERYDPVKKKEYNDRYIEENKEKLIKKCRAYYAKNSKKLNEQKRRYEKENKDKVNALASKRYARKVNASPKWITKEQEIEIRSFYEEARLKTVETGIKHEVDHIVPLRGKNVRGLHVPWNLRVITKQENCRKGNKL